MNLHKYVWTSCCPAGPSVLLYGYMYFNVRPFPGSNLHLFYFYCNYTSSHHLGSRDCPIKDKLLPALFAASRNIAKLLRLDIGIANVIGSLCILCWGIEEIRWWLVPSGSSQDLGWRNWFELVAVILLILVKHGHIELHRISQALHSKKKANYQIDHSMHTWVLK